MIEVGLMIYSTAYESCRAYENSIVGHIDIIRI